MSGVSPQRVVVLASADGALRGRLRASLSGMRWHVREAGGGAEALAHLEEQRADALLLDGWLPDLEVSAFTAELRKLYPTLELLRVDGKVEGGSGFLRNELLQALRESSDSRHSDGAVSRIPVSETRTVAVTVGFPWQELNQATVGAPASLCLPEDQQSPVLAEVPGLIGDSAPMRELKRLIRLVAPHNARVLVEGETGTGKELVAKALHVFSRRATKPFVVLNCAAIPEALLEAELFGHTRGAFTGAVQSRIGRVEAANGGTLFLDEIGEMPLGLQAKLLRFLENGELQRVGDNESTRVDVRVIAATHRQLDQSVEEGKFRLDLLHRLAIFPIEVPSLRDRLEDLPLLADHILSELGKTAPRKRLSPSALFELVQHSWPGNVRELNNVLQRAAILACSAREISASEIIFRRTLKAGSATR